MEHTDTQQEMGIPKSKLYKILTSINPSVYLFIATIIAIILANSSWAPLYFSWLDTPINFTIGSFSLFEVHGHPMSLSLFVNDALMALFFFAIGLEIKEEITEGGLSNPRIAILPIIAAVGGMVVPVAVFSLMVSDPLQMHGAAIPMATDIAFSLAVLSLLGKRVPASLKLFLVTLAVVDDIGGILVIALFYSTGIHIMPLLIGILLTIGAFILGKIKARQVWLYYLLFVIVWALFLRSGVHATIAGVLMGLAIPHKPIYKKAQLSDSLEKLQTLLHNHNDSTNTSFLPSSIFEKFCYTRFKLENTMSLSQRMHHALSPFVNFIILPLFAFVNAGVTFGEFHFNQLLELPLAITLGLLLGKTFGIFGATWLACKLRISKYPEDMTPANLFGISIFGGIGFTVALFIATLAFDINKLGDKGVVLLNEAKVGIFLGSLVSGILAYFVLKFILEREEKKKLQH